MRWYGKKNVSVISIYHTDERKEIEKQVSVIDYNERKGGI
jgi:hypothetical protein